MTAAANRDRAEKARLGARSAARDLLRLLRALEARGVELGSLDDDAREALEAVNQDLAEALSSLDQGPAEIEPIEALVSEARARLQATRTAILSGFDRARRSQVLEAMLAVEIVDEDLEVESIAQPSLHQALHHARERARRRFAYLAASEARRKRAEAQAIEIDAGLTELYGALPPPWRAAIGRDAGTDDPAALARWLGAPGRLEALVAALRPGERRALAMLLEADGVLTARRIEARFGGADEDGYDWDKEPPTSAIGRLRAAGLVIVGRAPIGRGGRRVRAVVVPADLRGPLARALAATPPAPRDEGAPVSPEVIEQLLAEGDESSPEEAELQALRFDRAQPELASFAASACEAAGDGGGAALVYYVERIWAMFEAAFPGRVPRLRWRDIEAARRASERELAAVEVMHERMLERRVVTLVGSQPHLYAFLARSLDDGELPLDEAAKAVVFHVCDTAIRAFQAALRA